MLIVYHITWCIVYVWIYNIKLVSILFADHRKYIKIKFATLRRNNEELNIALYYLQKDKMKTINYKLSCSKKK